MTREQEVFEGFRSLADPASHGAGASANEIEQAERELGVRLPKGYKAFLREFGWGGAGHWDVFGLGSDVPFHLDLVRYTKSERTEAVPAMPEHLIPLMNDGAGNAHALDTSGGSSDPPVVFWDHELDENQVPDEAADSFVSWLAERLDEMT